MVAFPNPCLGQFGLSWLQLGEKATDGLRNLRPRKEAANPERLLREKLS